MGGSVKKLIKKVSGGGLGLDLLDGPKEQKMPGQATVTPAGVPTVDDARQAAEQADLLRRRRGRASTILTGQGGDLSTVNVGTKTLLGG